MDSKQVLVVDDDDLVCWALKKELNALGLTVDGVATGAAALSCLHRKGYRLVFLEIDLRDRSGLDLIGPIRQAAPGTRIVMLTSEASANNKRTAFDRGACQFIEKPFDLEEVTGLVCSSFGDYEEKRAHKRYLCRLPLRLTIVPRGPANGHSELPNLGATTIDVARGGTRLRTSYPLRPGQTVRVSSPPMDDPCARFVPAETAAQVVWAASGTRTFHVGLRYLPTASPARTS